MLPRILAGQAAQLAAGGGVQREARVRRAVFRLLELARLALRQVLQDHARDGHVHLYVRALGTERTENYLNFSKAFGPPRTIESAETAEDAPNNLKHAWTP